MQQRETAALRLSVRTGDVDRARLAAERLFGLRLDSETQVQLAAEMRQLGMHEHAEAVLARARRQAGNRVGALVSLMAQYQVEQKPDLAVQVAHQILRRGGPALPGPNRVYREDDAARPQALQVLARSGKLKELIDRAEAQLKTSPGSTHLYQTLVEYYKAAGDLAKSLDALKKMAALRPDDARLQYQIGQQMAQSGKPAEAIEFYKTALKKEPALFGNSYWEVQQAYQQANKIEDLVKLLDEIDLKTMGNYWSVMNIVQNMMNNDKQRETALKLFRKGWQAFPNDRSSMLGYIHNDEIWKLPEIYDYARQATIPSDAVALNDPWGAANQVTSYMGDGRVSGLITRLVEAAMKQNRLPELKAEVEQGLQKSPGWLAGKALLAVVHARQASPSWPNRCLKSCWPTRKIRSRCRSAGSWDRNSTRSTPPARWRNNCTKARSISRSSRWITVIVRSAAWWVSTRRREKRPKPTTC
jgi:tetratricopeptide (TPR) repeat protein